MKNNKYLLFIFSIIITMALQIFTLNAAQVVDKIVAVVNDEIITQSELQESMIPFVADYKVRYGEEELADKIDEARKDALNRLIEEKLLLQEAIKREIAVTDDEVAARIETVKLRFKTEEEFNHTMKESGISMIKLSKKYKEQIQMRKLVNGLINQNVHITPSQIEAYYRGHQDAFSAPDMARFKVLQLKPKADRNVAQTEALALQILENLGSGEDFDMLVKKHSQGPNIDKGGDMSYMPIEGIIKELKDVIAELSPGEVSGLIRTSSGFNIIKLVDRRAAQVKPLTEVKALIRERLYQRESELTLREFMDNLKEDAYISIKE
ncbi:peptidyl-prolyl cis-trans isomerase [Candidatus Omnitrophota bacterium]